MKTKTLLLGSAAVLAMAGVAHAQATKTTTAAPAAVVKAPNYVTVCDAFGLGYFTTGTLKDTCLRVSGKIVFAVNFHTRQTEGPYGGTSSPHEAGWDTTSTGTLTFTARRMTDHGDLIGNMVLTGSSDNTKTITLAGTNFGTCDQQQKCSVPIDGYVKMSAIYIKLGGWEFGFDASVFGSGTTKQISYTYAPDTNTKLMIGLDDPRDRWGTKLPRYYWMPDIVGGATRTTPWGSWQFNLGVGDVSVPTPAGGNTGTGIGPDQIVWGGTSKVVVKLDSITKGDTATFSSAFGTGTSFSGSSGNSGPMADMFSVAIKHNLTAALNTTWTLAYQNYAPKAEQTTLKGAFVWTLGTVVSTLTATETLNNSIFQPAGQLQLVWTPVKENDFTLVTTVTGNETFNDNKFKPTGTAKAEFTWTY